MGVPIPEGLLSTLESWRRPVVLGHLRPDADCLGAMYAVALSWPADGEPARVSLPEGSISRRLRFLADWAGVPTVPPADFADADGFVVVDTGKHSRCNVHHEIRDVWSEGRSVINIDHHASNTQFGEFNWVDAAAGSTCELIHRLLVAADRTISPVVASMLYAGIHSDTVGFSLPSTASSALRAAADLVDSGARVPEIGEQLCRSQSQPEFELDRVIYDNTRLVADGRIAYSTASYEEITRSKCTSADIDDQVGIPRALRGIRMAILFTEGRKGKTRLNMRGEADVQVLELALQLGGGGHADAAGAILDASIEEAVQRVLPLAIEHLDRNHAGA